MEQTTSSPFQVIDASYRNDDNILYHRVIKFGQYIQKWFKEDEFKEDFVNDSELIFFDKKIQTDPPKYGGPKKITTQKPKDVKRYESTFRTFSESLPTAGIEEFEVPIQIYEIDKGKNEAKVSYFNSIEPKTISITELKILNPRL